MEFISSHIDGMTLLGIGAWSQYIGWPTVVVMGSIMLYQRRKQARKAK